MTLLYADDPNYEGIETKTLLIMNLFLLFLPLAFISENDPMIIYIIVYTIYIPALFFVSLSHSKEVRKEVKKGE